MKSNDPSSSPPDFGSLRFAARAEPAPDGEVGAFRDDRRELARLIRREVGASSSSVRKSGALTWGHGHHVPGGG